MKRREFIRKACGATAAIALTAFGIKGNLMTQHIEFLSSYAGPNVFQKVLW